MRARAKRLRASAIASTRSRNSTRNARSIRRLCRASSLKRARFLVTGLHGASADEAHTRGVLDGGAHDELRLGALLGAPAEIIALLERTLPREMSARVVGDLEQALTLSLATGAMYVTTEGE